MEISALFRVERFRVRAHRAVALSFVVFMLRNPKSEIHITGSILVFIFRYFENLALDFIHRIACPFEFWTVAESYRVVPGFLFCLFFPLR